MAEEEFDYALREGTAPRKEHPIPWLRISHITEIMRDRQALAVAKALWTKRDELAREYDISPTLLLADSTIIEVAERKPHNAAQFRRSVPSTSVYASKPVPNRRKCSNVTRRSNVKSSQACGRE